MRYPTVRKFPLQEAAKWQEFLAKQEEADQLRLFPSFMKWLAKAGDSWDLLASSGTGSQGGTKTAGRGSTTAHHSFYEKAEDKEKPRNS